MSDASSNPVSCPICGNLAHYAYAHPDCEIWRCGSCDHAFTRLDTMRKNEAYSAAYYDDEHKNWFENPDTELFQWIADNISPDARRVLDIGCGRGDFLRYLQRIRPSLVLVGVDLSPNEPEPGITYIQADIMDLNMNADHAGQYDAVVSLASIEHMEQPLTFARRMTDFCTSSGVVIVMTVNESGLLYRLGRVARTVGAPLLFNRLYSAHHLNHFSVKSLRRLLNEGGMKVEKTLYHNSPLAAVDLPQQLMPVRWLVLAVLAVIFALGKVTTMSLAQTVLARPKQ